MHSASLAHVTAYTGFPYMVRCPRPSWGLYARMQEKNFHKLLRNGLSRQIPGEMPELRMEFASCVCAQWLRPSQSLLTMGSDVHFGGNNVENAAIAMRAPGTSLNSAGPSEPCGAEQPPREQPEPDSPWHRRIAGTLVLAIHGATNSVQQQFPPVGDLDLRQFGLEQRRRQRDFPGRRWRRGRFWRCVHWFVAAEPPPRWVCWPSKERGRTDYVAHPRSPRGGAATLSGELR